MPSCWHCPFLSVSLLLSMGSSYPHLQVQLLHCPHFFHPSCIRQWYNINPSCPLCRR